MDARSPSAEADSEVAVPVGAPKGRGKIVRILVTLALATLGGAAANWINMPLPWMLGPLFVCATLSLLGQPVEFVPMGRELGQVAVGLAVGMRFTPAVLATTISLLPHMVLATLYVVLFTSAAAVLHAIIGNIDHKTAFFATAAGGMADMAVVAEERGGDPTAVSITHAIRVASVVSVVPFLVFAFGEQGSVADVMEGASDNILLIGLALFLAYATALLFKLTPFPNPWLVGPIFLGTVLGASGLLMVDVPWVLIVIAQILIGIWLGCRFRREILATLPRVALSALAVSIFMILAASLGAAVLAGASDLPFTTSFLALAPAAVTEMVITAQAMNTDAQIVTAFHVMRIAVVSSTILLVYALFRKLLEWTRGSPI